MRRWRDMTDDERREEERVALERLEEDHYYARQSAQVRPAVREHKRDPLLDHERPGSDTHTNNLRGGYT